MRPALRVGPLGGEVDAKVTEHRGAEIGGGDADTVVSGSPDHDTWRDRRSPLLAGVRSAERGDLRSLRVSWSGDHDTTEHLVTPRIGTADHPATRKPAAGQQHRHAVEPVLPAAQAALRGPTRSKKGRLVPRTADSGNSWPTLAIRTVCGYPSGMTRPRFSSRFETGSARWRGAPPLGNRAGFHGLSKRVELAKPSHIHQPLGSWVGAEFARR